MFLHKPGREKVTKTEITRTEHGKEELINLVEQILKEAKSQGATSAEVDIGTGAGLSVTVRMGEVEMRARIENLLQRQIVAVDL